MNTIQTKVLVILLSATSCIYAGQNSVSSNTHFNAPLTSAAPLIAEYEYTVSTPQQIGTSTTDNPGVYIFAHSIEYTTGDTLDAGIVIDSDNVTIDLNGGILHLNSSVTSTVHGIQVKAGYKNIKIKDGTISGFTGDGISIEGASGNLVSNVVIENVTLVSNRNGVVATYVHNATLSEVTAQDSTNSGNTRGICFSDSQSITIKDSSSSRNVTTATNATSYGICLNRCKASTIDNCVCNNNQGHGDTAGIYITDTVDDSNSNYVTGCTCNNNISSNADSHGIHLETCDLVYVKNCTLNSNIASASGNSSYGLKLESADNTTVEGNITIRNNFGFWDDEALASQTNMYIQNNAYHNVDKSSNIRDFYRTQSTPVDYVQTSVDALEAAATASNKSNVSIIIETP